MRYKVTSDGEIWDTHKNMGYHDNTLLCEKLNKLDGELRQTKKALKKSLIDKQRMRKEYVRLQVKMELKE